MHWRKGWERVKGTHLVWSGQASWWRWHFGQSLRMEGEGRSRKKEEPKEGASESYDLTLSPS